MDVVQPERGDYPQIYKWGDRFILSPDSDGVVSVVSSCTSSWWNLNTSMYETTGLDTDHDTSCRSRAIYSLITRLSVSSCDQVEHSARCVCVCAYGQQLSNETTFDLDIWHAGSPW